MRELVAVSLLDEEMIEGARSEGNGWEARTRLVAIETTRRRWSTGSE